MVDGTVVSGQPFKGYAAGATALPTVLGVNRTEGVLFAAITARVFSKKDPQNYPPYATYTRAIDNAFQPNNPNSTLVSQLAANSAANGLYDLDLALCRLGCAGGGAESNPGRQQQPRHAQCLRRGVEPGPAADL